MTKRTIASFVGPGHQCGILPLSLLFPLFSKRNKFKCSIAKKRPNKKTQTTNQADNKVSTQTNEQKLDDTKLKKKKKKSHLEALFEIIYNLLTAPQTVSNTYAQVARA